MLNTLYLKFQS